MTIDLSRAHPQFITVDWQAPANVHAFMTTRIAGVSTGAFGQKDGEAGFNLATHVNDDAHAVSQNRAILTALAQLPSEPMWLNQTHSTLVHVQTNHEYQHDEPAPEADAVVITQAGQVGVIMTADCLPVTFASADGKVIGAAHAGWRGLVDGILEETVHTMTLHGATHIQAWLGAAISEAAFEVGQDVLDEFKAQTPAAAGDVSDHFKPHPEHAGKYLANLYGLARDRLRALGLTQITGGDLCTFSDETRFYSYRRDKITGRMATVIWMDAL